MVVVVVGPVVFVGCCVLPGVGVLARSVELPVVLCCVVRLFFVSVLIAGFVDGAEVLLSTLVASVAPGVVVVVVIAPGVFLFVVQVSCCCCCCC